jgi:glycine cleavage system regulatory protein
LDGSNANLVLTVIGPDRPGLVSIISETVTAGGGNWLDTRMQSLAGMFAGILLVAVPAEKAQALLSSLRGLETQGLRLIIETAADIAPPPAGHTATLDLVGLDRPGIVRDLSRVLAEQRVSIVELETERTSASFSGEPMFKARAVLALPEGLGIDALQASIEGLARELMVDLTLGDSDTAA